MKKLKTHIFEAEGSLIFLGGMLLMLGMPLSKAFLSLAPAPIGLAALLYLIRKKDLGYLKQRPWVWPLFACFLLCLASYFYTENIPMWVKDVKEKLILGLVPLALAIVPPLSRKLYTYLYYLFILAITFTALASLYFYIIDYEAVTLSIEKNKAVDIIGRMHHSYFGFLQAFCVLLCVDLGTRGTYIHVPQEKAILLGLALLHVVLIHLFASRTGMLCLYAGAFAYLVFQAWHSSRKGIFLGILLGMVCIPIISYYTLPSFKNRVDVSRWDLQQYFISDRDLSEKSFSQRILVWRSSWKLFRDSPILGVGIADVEDELTQRASFDQTRVDEENRLKSPHNQYLEYLAGYGLVGFLLLIISCIFPLLVIRPGFAILYTLVAIWMTAMIFESILERLVGISFVYTFLMTLPLFNQTDKTQS